MINTVYRVASVHGRFQPPHLDHLEYIEAGIALAEHLIIGITQPEIEALVACPEDPHRAQSNENPFTYSERCNLIRAMLTAKEISSSRFSFSRFPIETPDILNDFIATNIPCLTTIRDEWNLVKIERLRALNYSVHVLWDRTGQPGIRGSDIRKKIAENDASWRDALHPSVTSYLIDSGLLEKITLMPV
jgi:cytidyltransferase-like protein